MGNNYRKGTRNRTGKKKLVRKDEEYKRKCKGGIKGLILSE